MTNKQYRTRKLTVGTVQKSIATMASRWFRRKPSQRFAGSPRRWTARRYRDTDRSESTKPSFSSSPWILGAPQDGFSRAILRMRSWISAVILALPGAGPRDHQRQYNRNPARCQPTTVSGFTISSTSAQRDQTLRNAVQNNRSIGLSLGRGRLRFRTATCWRKARILGPDRFDT